MTSQKERYDQELNGWKAVPGAFAGERRTEQVFGHVMRLQPERLLDIGCVDGRLVRLVKASCPRVMIHSCDLSSVALGRAEGIARRYTVNLDEDRIPEPDGSMDLIIASEVIEHLVNPRHVLAEVRRVLRPRGRVLPTVPNVAFWRFRLQALRGQVPSVTADERHLHSYNARTLGELLTSEGLRPVMITGLRNRFERLGRLSYTLLCDTLLVEAERSS